jgi:hypothetical protein
MKFAKLRSYSALGVFAAATSLLTMSGCAEYIQNVVFCGTVTKDGKPVTGPVDFHVTWIAGGFVKSGSAHATLDPTGTGCTNGTFGFNNYDANEDDFDVISTSATITVGEEVLDIPGQLVGKSTNDETMTVKAKYDPSYAEQAALSPELRLQLALRRTATNRAERVNNRQVRRDSAFGDGAVATGELRTRGGRAI